MEITSVSINGWMNKISMVNIYYGILLNHEKLRNTAIYNSMDGSWRYYTKWNISKILYTFLIYVLWYPLHTESEEKAN